ncbi:MAG TPA: 5-formyltetrahydrofolate cyclo-ligase [Ilumatobacter sp.]|nr:5-formyltetrahydrofolate cyclo-ligase [Ilumatobacter sp.]
MTPPTSTNKAELRADMRALRKALPDSAERSERVWQQVEMLPAVRAANCVMVFTSVLGEPDTAPFISWCTANGKSVLLPEDDPLPHATTVDVVIVPGLAFTIEGDRLGQGGGWYDRFLSGLRPEAVTIGVAFAPQIVDALPVEPHDIRVDHVITA